MKRPKIMHVIGSLDVGGTQVALCKLLAHADRTGAEYQVVSLISGGALVDNFTSLGIPVCSLGMKNGVLAMAGLYRLVKLLAVERPDVVVTWMYHANLLGGAAAKFCGCPSVIWNVRNSGAEVSPFRPMTRLVVQLGKVASRVLRPQIAFVSEASRRTHADRGYASANTIVVPNGFETSLYRPDPAARHSVRTELGLAPDCRLVGIVARVHPDKDHSNFISAARSIHARKNNTHFMLCGEGATVDNEPLLRQINNAGIRSVTHLMGRRFDIPRIMASLDVSVLSSSAEAFPNAAGEAMSCAVPCVVTDVGDSALLIGDTGKVVPPRDSNALAQATLEILSLSYPALCELGLLARQRILNHFSIEKVVAQYEQLWLSAVESRPFAQGTSRNHRKAA